MSNSERGRHADPNTLIILWIVRTLCVLTIGGVAGLFVLAFLHIDIPDAIVAIVGGAASAIAALLAKTHIERQGESQSVTIDQPVDKPVPVEETPSDGQPAPGQGVMP